MTQREIVMLEQYGIAPDSEVCGNCKHFIQHCVFGSFVHMPVGGPLHCGHCTYPRLKNRTVHDSCDKFEPAAAAPDEDGVGCLSSDEQKFIEGYRRLPEDAQRAVALELESLAGARELRTSEVIPLLVETADGGIKPM